MVFHPNKFVGAQVLDAETQLSDLAEENLEVELTLVVRFLVRCFVGKVGGLHDFGWQEKEKAGFVGCLYF